LRGAIGRRHFKLVWRGVSELKLYLGVIVWWLVLASVPFWPVAAADRVACFVLGAIAPFAVMTWRKRSLGRAVYSVVSWCFNAAGLVRGFLRPRVPPRRPIASLILHEPPRSQQAQKRQRIA
jgi:hypothetical protein